MMVPSRMSRVLSVLLACVFAFSLAAYGTSSSSASNAGRKALPATAHSAQPGVLRYWMNWGDLWPKTLDPALPTDTLSNDNISLVYANLVKTSYPSLKIVPDLATWTVSRNHKYYTFHINPRARFSNGDQVTASDAAYSIRRALAPATKSPVATTYLGEIVGALRFAAGKSNKLPGVKVLNRRTLQIHIVDAVPYFLGALSYPTADVLDAQIMRGKAPGAYLTNDCSGNVGAGPFEYVCRNRSNSKSSFYPAGHTPYTSFRPNPYYFGKKPRIRIIDTFFSKSDDVYHAYEAGELDGTPVPPADILSARKRPGFSKVPGLITDYITPNQQIPPFNNINCRLAVAYAIDRVGVTTKLLRGTEGPLYGVLPPGLLGYFGKIPGVPDYNPTKARAYLNKCPGRLQNVTMTYQDTSTDLAHEYNAIRAEIAAIGGNITLKPLTFDAWLNVVGQNMNVTKSQEQITENLWLDDYPDPQDWFSNLLVSGANYDIGGFNNAQFNRLANKGNHAFNLEARARYYQEAGKIAVNTGAWIAVGYQDDVFIINPRVHGMINTAAGSPFPVNNDWSKVTVR